MNRDLIEQQISNAKQHLAEVEEQMSDLAVLSNQSMLSSLGREHRRLRTILDKAALVSRYEKELDQARSLLDEKDPDIIEMVEQEIVEIETKLEKYRNDLYLTIIPQEQEDGREAIMEIRAGTGGEEAGLFARELYKMYQRYFEKQGWRHEVYNSHPSERGGFKEIVFAVHGENTYGILKYESGVHRVQRVPLTESQGRLHTSAATVAVLPEVEEVDLVIDPDDLRIDVYRSSGHGGQSVNTTDSAVRITHLPSGVVVTCQDERSQYKNKIRAMRILRARLYETTLEEERSKRSANRKSLVGTGDRSAKIRTYNYPQNRVTDHRINLTLYRLNEILEGELDEIIDALRIADAENKIKGCLEPRINTN